jgi:lipopolysaccharide transport system ATP-binding protein
VRLSPDEAAPPSGTAPAPGGIALSGVSKHYRLYAHPVHRLAELLLPGRATRHKVVRALEDVTLSIRPGERVGILGQNGSGKSTLLKVISQVLTPSAGKVKVTGRVSALLELGIGFVGELPGRENVLQYGILQGLTREEITARYDEIVAFAELGEFIEQPIRTYSSGMVLRLAFACAVFTDPDVLIIDEALSVGDSYFQAKCLHKIRGMLERGITFLYVSRSLDSVRSLCDRGVLMEHGRAVLDGPADEVAREYERRAFLRASRFQGQPAAVDAPARPAIEDEAVRPARPALEDGAVTPAEHDFARRVAAMRIGSGRVRVTNIELAGAAGEPTDSIAHGETLEIRVGYRVTEAPAENSCITVSICDRLGNQLVHFNSLDKGVDLAGAAPGTRGSLSFRIRNSFCPGQYAVIAGVGAMKRHPTAPAFWVTDDTYDYCIGGAVLNVPLASATASMWGAISLPYEAIHRIEGPLVKIALPGLPPFAMRVHAAPDAFVSREIARNGVWEPFETQVVREILRYVDAFVDVGANIGWYSLVAGLTLRGRGRVIAFEPDPTNFALLARNVAENRLGGHVRLHHAALADAAGQRALFRSPDNLGDHRLYGGGSEGRAAVPVAVTTFDAAAAPHIVGPCLVKMDTQGSEVMILAGMRGYLAARARDTALLVEFWPFGLSNAGSSAAALVAMLEPLGMRAWLVDEPTAALVPTTLEELAARAEGDLRPETQGFANVLLIPPGHPAEAAIAALRPAAAKASPQEIA